MERFQVLGQGIRGTISEHTFRVVLRGPSTPLRHMERCNRKTWALESDLSSNSDSATYTWMTMGR